MNRLLLLLLAASIALVGCGELQDAGTQVRSASQAEQPSVTTNVYAMNPFPRLSSKAQALKYPPGSDTVAYWGNGRFSVVLNNFFDEEASSLPSFKGIRAMRQEGSVVYFAGDDGFLVLDLAAATHRRFATKEVIPAELSEPIARVQDPNDPKNIVFDPKTLMPVRKK
jgi:hypothetical protein